MTSDELLAVKRMRDYALETIDSIHDYDDAGKIALVWTAIGNLATGLAQLAEHIDGTQP
jgi:hypothetical protein